MFDVTEFHQLTVLECRDLTAKAVEITLSVPDELKDDFAFQAGQFVFTRQFIDGVEVERAYSICSAPFERKLSIAVKRIEGGVFSTYATTQLSARDSLLVSKPAGGLSLIHI